MGDENVTDETVEAVEVAEAEDSPAPWERYRGTSLLTQIAGVARGVLGSESAYREEQAMFDAGLDANTGEITLKLNIVEQHLLIGALACLGFFSEKLGDPIDALARRIEAENHIAFDALTEEQEAEIEKIGEQAEMTLMAEVLGVTPEELAKGIAQAEADIIDGPDEEGPVLQ